LFQVLAMTLGRLPAAPFDGGGQEAVPPRRDLLWLGLALALLIGLPPSPGFAARWAIAEAALTGGLWPVALLALVGAALAAGYGLSSIFAAKGNLVPLPPADGSNEASGRYPASDAVVLALPAVVLGLAPSLLSRLVEPYLAGAVGAGLAVAYPERPPWLAFGLALLCVLLGAALAARSPRADRVRPRVLAASRAAQAQRGRARQASRGKRQARLGWSGLAALGSRAVSWLSRLEEGPYAAVTLGLAAVALVVLAI
jgi:hypothetical protein